MGLARRAFLVTLPLVLGAALSAAAFGAAAKKPPRPKKGADRFLLQIVAVDHDDGVKNDALDAQAREVLAALVTERPADFVDQVDGAPDPKVDAAAYQAFLAKKKVRAFDVRLKFKKYARTLTPVPGSSDQTLTVSVEVELLGARPDGTLAFTGKGTAEVMAQVDKKVPPKMDAGVHADALKGALGHALDEAVLELRKPVPPPKKK